MNLTLQEQTARWKAAKARMGMGSARPVIAYQRPPQGQQTPIQAPTSPLDAANRARAARREQERAERAERIRLQVEADRKALQEARAEANQHIRAIILATANHFGIPASELLSDRRTAGIVLPRKVAMYLAKELTPHSYPNIGKRFRRDHTTVLHAVRNVEGLVAAGEPKVVLAIAEIKEALGYAIR